MLHSVLLNAIGLPCTNAENLIKFERSKDLMAGTCPVPLGGMRGVPACRQAGRDTILK